MNITAVKNGDYALKLNMKFDESDYQDAVKKELNKQRQKAQIHGFRPGSAPIKLIEKMYGKAILADKVNELISQELEKYITEEKLETLVSPIPSKDSAALDFDNATSFEFSFDVALAPEISLDFINDSKTVLYNIKVDKKLIDNDLEHLQRQFMKLEETEVAANNNYLALAYETKELGLKSAYLVIGKDTTEAIDKKFIGVKKNDEVTLDVLTAFDNDEEKASKFLSLRTDEEKAHVKGSFTFKVENIQHEILPPLDEDLFSKAFPGKDIKTLEEAKKQMEKRHAASYEEASDINLYNNIITYYLDNVQVDFNDEILRRYLDLERINHQENVLTDEEYKEYRKAYCQDLLLQKFVKEFDIKVEKEDLKNSAKNKVARYFGMDPSDENEYMNSIIDNLLKDEKQMRDLYMEALANKIIDKLKETYQFVKKSVSMEEFQKLNAPETLEATEEAPKKKKKTPEKTENKEVHDKPKAEKKESKPKAGKKDSQLEMPLE